MNESRWNPKAQAARGLRPGEQLVDVLPLGDDYGLLGVGLKPSVDAGGNLTIYIVASVCQTSELVGIHHIAQVSLGSLPPMPVAVLKEKHREATEPKAEPTPEPAA